MRLLQKFGGEGKKVFARVITADLEKSESAMEIMELKKAGCSNRGDVFIHEHIELINYTKVFCRITGEIVLEPRLIILAGRYTLYVLNSRYSALLKLTDDFLDIISNKTSLHKGSRVEKSDKASLGEKDK